MLKGHAQSARRPEDTDRSSYPEPSGKSSVEVENKRVANILSHPLVEDTDQETAKLLRLHRPVRNLVSFLVATFVVTLNDGDELDVMCPKVVSEKSVDLKGTVGVFGVDRAEYVELHIVLLKQPGAPHHPIEGSMSSPVFTVDVMKFHGAVKAQANEETVFMKEPTPLVVEKDTVRLEGIFDACPWLCVFFLEFDGVPEEIDSHEGWFSALPRNRHLRGFVSFEKLPDIGLVDLI